MLEPLLFVAVIIFAIIEAIIDEKKSRKRKIEHGISAVARLCISFLANIYLYSNIWYTLGFTVLHMGLYWIVFDVVFGYIRTKNPWYLGNTSFLDRLIKKTTGGGASGVLIFKLCVTSFLAIILFSFAHSNFLL